MALFGQKKRPMFLTMDPTDQMDYGPYRTPGIGDGLDGAAGLGFRSPESEKKGGFFRKGGPGQYILAGISDFIARRQGYQPTAALGIMQQAQQEQQARQMASQSQMQRAQELADWRWKEDYKRENPSETAMERNFEAFQSMSPEQQSEFLRYQDMVNPLGSIGPDGRFYNRPRAASQLPDKPVGKLRPYNPGGTASNGGGGFR